MEETPIIIPFQPDTLSPLLLPNPQKQAQLELKVSINGSTTTTTTDHHHHHHQEESGRDRLKRCRVEMAGRVWIPDIWGQEEFMKDWIDCKAFDGALVRSNIMSARTALIEGEGSRRRRLLTSSSPGSLENRCN